MDEPKAAPPPPSSEPPGEVDSSWEMGATENSYETTPEGHAAGDAEEDLSDIL